MNCGLAWAAAAAAAWFPIGIYELPKSDTELRRLREAGFNLVPCGPEELDRVKAAGLRCWVHLPLESGASPRLRQAVEEVRNHPAVAVWAGPDEAVWNFTAFSGLFRSGVHKQAGEWWLQTPNAVTYAETQARKVLPAIVAGARMARSLDPASRPIWINEAASSDVQYIREYLPAIDVTGFDLYPVRAEKPEPATVGDHVDRYMKIARGKPVWAVLQGFSWHLIPGSPRGPLFPSLEQSRLMAWSSIAHGARGILYWGTTFLRPEDGAFRETLLEVARELAPLEPFLLAGQVPGVRADAIEHDGRRPPGERGVRVVARRVGGEWLIALVNEDNRPQMAVEVSGLLALEGRTLHLRGGGNESVRGGGFVTRMTPHQVKVFQTRR